MRRPFENAAERQRKAHARHAAATARLLETERNLEEAARADDDAALTRAYRARKDALESHAQIKLVVDAADAAVAASNEAEKRAALLAQIDAAASFLKKRNAAAERLAAALETAHLEWANVLTASVEAVNAYPHGFPAGALCAAVELRLLLANEFYRISGGQNRERNFPGSRAPSFNLVDNPQAIPAFADVVRRSSAFVIEHLNARAASKGNGHG